MGSTCYPVVKWRQSRHRGWVGGVNVWVSPKEGRGAHLEQISFFLRSVSENAARRPLKTEMVDPSSPGPRMKDGQKWQ